MIEHIGRKDRFNLQIDSSRIVGKMNALPLPQPILSAISIQRASGTDSIIGSLVLSTDFRIGTLAAREGCCRPRRPSCTGFFLSRPDICFLSPAAFRCWCLLFGRRHVMKLVVSVRYLVGDKLRCSADRNRDLRMGDLEIDTSYVISVVCCRKGANESDILCRHSF